MAGTHQDSDGPAPVRRLRSGTAARLAGLPVTTLRVWERRYRIVAANKTASGQRVYSLDDVARLRLMRQLTRAGHAIGTIAMLDLESLQALAGDVPAFMDLASLRTLDVVVVGPTAAQAVDAIPGCTLRAIHDDLEQARSATRPAGPTDLLLVRLASLQAADGDRVLALGAALRAAAVLVVYAFGTEATADGLRRAGVDVRREPWAAADLARWVGRLRTGSSPAAAAGLPDASLDAVEPRRFSDETLARLIEQPSSVACECQRHMAEIVAHLAGFERYSDDCVSTGPADAALHRALSRTAGAARTLFERALQRVVDER